MSHQNCTICSSLKDQEESYYKNGQEENENSQLPAAAYKLIVIYELPNSNSSRLKQVKQCPECKTHYFYRTDYEFLAGGSEDEEFLTRLTKEEALKYLPN
jgi:hypothetical protein